MPGISRRKFITGIAVAGSGACVCGLGGCATFTKIGRTPAISAGAYVLGNNKVKIDLIKVPELGKIGGSVKITDSGLSQPIIIARNSEAEYAVVSIKCPHRGVEVEYRHTDKQFRCASLGSSSFAMDGAYKKGIAKKSLSKFNAKLDPLDKNTLIISI